MMFSLHIDTDLLGRRLDPAYYSPSALEEVKRLKSAVYETKTLRKLCPRMNSGPFGSALLAEHYVEKSDRSVVFFRPIDCKDLIADINNDNAFISPEDNQRLKSSSFPNGALIFTKIGNSIGDVSVVPHTVSNCNISGNMMGMVPSQADPYYIVSFLKSPSGASQIQRGIIGGPMPKIDTESLSEIIISVPSAETQRAVGNKVRKAERLRELAEDAHASFLRWLSIATETQRLTGSKLAFLDHVPSKTCSDKAWITEFDLADRVDPWPHHVAPRTIRGHLRSIARTKEFDEFFEVVTESRPRISPPLLANCYHLSILDVDDTGRINWDNAAKTRYDGPGVTILGGDILYSTLNPQETRIGYIPTGAVGTIAASPEFSTLRLREGFADYPYLATAVLRSNWVRVQASFLTRSSSLSRRRLAEDDFAKILVPWNEEGASELETKVALASDAYIQAGVLIDQAKADVESLISNTLDLDALHAESAAIESWLAANPSPVASMN